MHGVFGPPAGVSVPQEGSRSAPRATSRNNALEPTWQAYLTQVGPAQDTRYAAAVPQFEQNFAAPPSSVPHPLQNFF